MDILRQKKVSGTGKGVSAGLLGTLEEKIWHGKIFVHESRRLIAQIEDLYGCFSGL